MNRITIKTEYGRQLLSRLEKKIAMVQKNPGMWKVGYLDILVFWKNVLITEGIDVGSQETKVRELVAEAEYNDPIYAD